MKAGRKQIDSKKIINGTEVINKDKNPKRTMRKNDWMELTDTGGTDDLSGQRGKQSSHKQTES